MLVVSVVSVSSHADPMLPVSFQTDLLNQRTFTARQSKASQACCWANSCSLPHSHDGNGRSAFTDVHVEAFPSWLVASILHDRVFHTFLPPLPPPHFVHPGTLVHVQHRTLENAPPYPAPSKRTKIHYRIKEDL